MQTYTGDVVALLGAGNEWSLAVMVAKGQRAPLLGRNWISEIPISWPKVCRLLFSPTVETITELHPDLCAPGLGTINTGTTNLLPHEMTPSSSG